jgi:hypothetical protein
VIKETKAHSNASLAHKLYVIGLGTNLNCSIQVPLQVFCTNPPDFLDFVFISGDELISSFDQVPEGIEYVKTNRTRTNYSLKRKDFNELQLVVASQLLALSCLMQIPPDGKILQDFCRSLPEVWLLPAVSELLRQPLSVEIHIQCVNLFSGILVVSEGQTPRQEVSSSHLIASTTALLAAQQQHGLIQTLLRDLSGGRSILPEVSSNDNSFIEALLHLANLIADYKYKVDSSHVAGMTCSLLSLIQSETLSLNNKTKAIRVLSVVVSHSIDMFKVISGLETVMKVLMKELNLYNQSQNNTQVQVIKVLLRLLKIVATKWDSSHTLGHSEVSLVLFDSGFLQALKSSFEMRLYDLYEQSLQLLSCFVSFHRQVIHDLIQTGLLEVLLGSLEQKLPSNAKLVAVLGRFLSALTDNDEVVRVLGRFNTVQRMIEALGSGFSVGLTNDLADNIGESLQTLMNNVPELVQSGARGLVALIRSLEAADVKRIPSKEVFFQQMTHTSKIISCLFTFSDTILDLFISEGGVDSYLNIFRLEIVPQTYNNEFHSFGTSCRTLTTPKICSIFLRKVIEKLQNQLNELEDLLGPLSSIQDFSHMSDSTKIIHILTACDSYNEILRYLLASSGSLIESSEDLLESLCEVLERLSHYMRILIAEQARLSPFSKSTNKKTTTFNQPINIQEIENVNMKTFEENFYFTCQLTVRKLYKYTTIRMTNPRGKFMKNERSGVMISNTMGCILAQLIKLIDLQMPDQGQAYYFCLQLSDILKILLQDQHPNLSTIITFHSAGGSEHVRKFLMQLRRISADLSDEKEKSYDLVNSLQILWNLCGKFLEVLAMGKTSTPNPAVLKDLGFVDTREVHRVMQEFAYELLKELNFLHCGVFSTAFAKSALDILKAFSDIDKVEVDKEVVRTVAGMGFPEAKVETAIKVTNSVDISKILDYLSNSREFFEEQVKIESVHDILINSLPAIPVLKSHVADMLAKICCKNPGKVKEIVFKLSLELGILMKELMSDDSLFNLMSSKTSIELLPVPPNFEQLSALITIFSVLVHKSTEVLENLKSLNFLDFAIKIIENFSREIDLTALKCLSPLFSFVEGLSRVSPDNCERLTRSVCGLIRIHSNLPSIDHCELNSLIQLLITLTNTTENCRVFIESKALKDLLALKSGVFDEKQARNTISCFSTLLKQVTEDPFILQGSFEVNLLQGFKEGIELMEFLKLFSVQIGRSKEIFLIAFKNACVVLQEGKKFVIGINKDRKEVHAERWKTVSIITQALCDTFEGEQKGLEFIMPSQELVAVLADIFKSYPVLIKDIVNQSIKPSKHFLSYLIKQVIPFRYTLNLEDDKVAFFFPSTTNPVPIELFQSWLKSTSKLIKSLTFKQHIKNYTSSASEVFNQVILDNNQPIVKARKRIFKELKEVLQKHSKKSWFGNEKSMAAVRSAVVIIMQLLNEKPKSPFSTTNPAEIAKSLISDPVNMVKLLTDIAKGVKINASKAGAMLNLILSALDFLTKYNMSFTVNSSKPEVEPEDEQDDLGKFELFETDEQFVRDDNESQSDRISMEVDHELEDSDSEVVPEIQQDAVEEEDDEDLLEESDQVEDNLENVHVQDRNTEAFWADRLEEDQDPALHMLNLRQLDEYSADQDIDREFSMEQEEIWDRLDRNEEEPPLLNFYTEIDHNDPDLMQMVFRRSRIHLELPDRSKPRVDENSSLIEEVFTVLRKSVKVDSSNLPSSALKSKAKSLKTSAPEGPNDPESSESESSENREHSEDLDDLYNAEDAYNPENVEDLEDLDNCEDLEDENLDNPEELEDPEALDDDFLHAIPEDLREEILNMHSRGSHPPSNEIDNSTFIASLTPDLRREILMTAGQDLLQSLTAEQVAEARALQERVRRSQPSERQRPGEEGKVISEIIADEKLSATLASVEDGLLEVLVKALYLLNPINRDIFSSLLLNLSVQGTVRGKLLDSLLALLEQQSPGKDFPPQKLYGSETYLENYSQVYAIVTGRILDLLLHLAQNNGKVSSDLVGTCKFRLSLIKGIKGNDEVRGVAVLLGLARHKLFETSSSHLTPLVELVSCVVEKVSSDVPVLEDLEISTICSLFRYECLSDSSVKRVVDLVAVLVKQPRNKQVIEKILFKSFTLLGKEIANNLKKLETSKDGQKELQLLRIFKVFKATATENANLDYLWGPLTDALNMITNRESDFASSANPTLSKILPLIETFFLAHVGQSSEYFQKFCDKHRKVLNILIKQNPSILQDTFRILVFEFPALLDFENKRFYFRSEIRKLRPERSLDSIRLQVRRPEVFEDSFHQLKVKTPAEMHGKLRVSFIDEDGVDAGGLTREWYGLLAREMFNPDYALFIPSANGVSFQPNCMSSINAEHLEYFKFIGRIIGKALCDGYALDVYFTRSFYKHILSQEVDYHDMEDLDPDFFKNLKMLMDINLNESDIHEYYFVVEEEEFGSKQMKELEPGGTFKRVTEDNKMEYIKLLCHMKMTANISAQIKSFLEGFHELVPKAMIGIFDSKELELLISGLPEIDIEDLKGNTEYHNYTKDSSVIIWLWEVLNEFSYEERAEFLQFVTGSSKVPLEGFKALPGMNGVQKFQIHKSFTGPDRLPTAHTCMNQIDLPEYPSKELLRNRIKLAITEGKEGFGFM